MADLRRGTTCSVGIMAPSHMSFLSLSPSLVPFKVLITNRCDELTFSHSALRSSPVQMCVNPKSSTILAQNLVLPA